MMWRLMRDGTCGMCFVTGAWYWTREAWPWIEHMINSTIAAMNAVN